MVLSSYGARDEIVGACKKIAAEVVQGKTAIDDINEDLLSNCMLTAYVLVICFLCTCACVYLSYPYTAFSVVFSMQWLARPGHCDTYIRRASH